MATQPTVFPRFAVLDLNNGTGAAPNVVEPTAGKKDTGWNEGERPPRETFNWLHRITNDWIEWFDQELGAGALTGNFQELPALHSGLNFFVSGGIVQRGGVQLVENQTATLLADDDVNYVYWNATAADVQAQLVSFPNNKDNVPLFVVTTVAGAITTVVEARTWATIPGEFSSVLNSQEIRTSGYGYDIVQLGEDDSTPTPDCELGNIFRQTLKVPTSVTIGTPLNPEALSANQTQQIIILLTLKPGDFVAFSGVPYRHIEPGAIEFASIDSREGGDYIIKMVYEPALNTWFTTVKGPDDGQGLTSGNKIRKYKPSNETRSAVGVSNDTDLTGFILPIGLYRVKGFIPFGETPGNGGIDMNWQPGLGTIVNDSVWVTSNRSGGGSPDTNEMGAFFITSGADLTLTQGLNDATYAQIDGTFEITVNSSISFQWAPVNAVALSILAGAWIEFERLGS